MKGALSMHEVNPCEGCKGPCGYRLFIYCPIWLEWAARENALEEQETEGDYQ